MSVKISHIDLEEGESISIRFKRSIENSIHIFWKHDQLPIIEGPMNKNSSSYTVSVKYGIQKIPIKE